MLFLGSAHDSRRFAARAPVPWFTKGFLGRLGQLLLFLRIHAAAPLRLNGTADEEPPKVLASAGAWHPVDVVAEPLELSVPPFETAGLKLLGGFWMRSTDPSWKGMLSGIVTVSEPDATPARFLAISDNGTWYELQLTLGTEKVGLESVRAAPLLDGSGADVQSFGYGTIFEGTSHWRDDLLVVTEPSRKQIPEFNSTRTGSSAIWRYNLAGVLQGGSEARARATKVLGLCQMHRRGLEAVSHFGPDMFLALCEGGKRGFIVQGDLAHTPVTVAFPALDDLRLSGLELLTASDSTGTWDFLALFNSWRGEIRGSGSALRFERLLLTKSGTGNQTSWRLSRHPVHEAVQLSQGDGYPIENAEGLAIVQSGGRTMLVVVSDNNHSPGCQRTILLVFEMDLGEVRSVNSSLGKPVEYCGPTTVDAFKAVGDSFWMPPPSLGKLKGSVVFTRHGDRTPLSTFLAPTSGTSRKGKQAPADPSWMWGSSCARYFEKTVPLQSLRSCASRWEPSSCPVELQYNTTVPDAIQEEQLHTVLDGLSTNVQDDGQLTLLGANQLQEVGKLYGQRYSDMRLDTKSLQLRSTSFNRTVLSADAFVQGFRSVAPLLIPAGTPLLVDAVLTSSFTPAADHNLSNSFKTPKEPKHLRAAKNATAKRLGLTAAELFDTKAVEPLHDCLQISTCWNKMWAWPRGMQDPRLREELLSIRLQEWVLYCSASLRNGGPGPNRCEVLLRWVLAEAFQRLSGGGFSLYSGHDSTLLPLFVALKLADIKFPSLASHLALELYRASDGTEQVVVLLNGQLQRSLRCAGELCSLEELRRDLAPSGAVRGIALPAMMLLLLRLALAVG